MIQMAPANSRSAKAGSEAEWNHAGNRNGTGVSSLVRSIPCVVLHASCNFCIDSSQRLGDIISYVTAAHVPLRAAAFPWRDIAAARIVRGTADGVLLQVLCHLNSL